MSVNVLNNLVYFFKKREPPALPTLAVWKSGVGALVSGDYIANTFN